MHDAEPPSHFGSLIVAIVGAPVGAGGFGTMAVFSRRSPVLLEAGRTLILESVFVEDQRNCLIKVKAMKWVKEE
jgi:hypothetical protein